MKKESSKSDEQDMRDEYDFTSGARGKYAKRFAAGSIAVVLDPDVAEVFHDSQSVNDALRVLANLIREQGGASAPRHG